MARTVNDMFKAEKIKWLEGSAGYGPPYPQTSEVYHY